MTVTFGDAARELDDGPQRPSQMARTHSLAVTGPYGRVYGVPDMKSLALPVVALVGLLAMLSGEQIGKRVASWHFSVPAASGTAVHEKSSVAT